jgi:hypothetical protein
MSGPFANWLRLPSRIALLLGIGALSATAAKAEPSEMHNGSAPVPQQSAKSFGRALVWNEDGRIYVSEGGEPARELRLGDTPEARHLRELLERGGATAGSPHIVEHRMILVGGGGMGISGGHWQRADRPDALSAPAATTGHPPRTRTVPKQTSPEDPSLPGRANTTRVPEKG